MITSSSIQFISQVLHEPQNISDTDTESIDALTEAYPYFVPARYLQAANQHKHEAFAAPMMSRMQLYSGNWLLYTEFLKASLGDEPVIAEEVQEVVPVAAEAIPEEELQEEPEAAIIPETVTGEPIAEETIAEEPIAEEPIAEEPIAETAEEDIITPEAEEEQTVAPEAEELEPDVVATLIPEAVIIATEEPATETTFAPQKEDSAFIQHEKTPAEEPLFTQRRQSEKDITETDESFILPIYTEDYFLHQGMHVSNKIPNDLPKQGPGLSDEDKQLMVVMSFTEWLMFFKTRKEKETDEAADKKAVKTMWQKEKLAAALEEENEEIPEKVFEMAVNSIAKEDDLVSESLAEIHQMQGRYDKSIEMYRKLSLRNPQKKAYFARKIESILKDKQS